MAAASTSATTTLTMRATAKIAPQSLDWMKKARKKMEVFNLKTAREALVAIAAKCYGDRVSFESQESHDG